MKRSSCSARRKFLLECIRVSAAASFAAFHPRALLAQAPPAHDRADLVWVHKSKRKLYLLRNYQIIRSYAIALGKNPRGHKVGAGDSRTPEGWYLIDGRNPDSRFHLSLHISYPNENDVHRAKRRNIDPGGDIMIHGVGDAESGKHDHPPGADWTDGCIALSNREVEEIWQLVADGTPILIAP